MNDLEREGQGAGKAAEDAGDPMKLFKFTSTQPGLYWMPLREEQVQQLREASAARKLSQELRAARASAPQGEDGDRGEEPKHEAKGSPRSPQVDAAEDVAAKESGADRDAVREPEADRDGATNEHKADAQDGDAIDAAD